MAVNLCKQLLWIQQGKSDEEPDSPNLFYDDLANFRTQVPSRRDRADLLGRLTEVQGKIEALGKESQNFVLRIDDGEMQRVLERFPKSPEGFQNGSSPSDTVCVFPRVEVYLASYLKCFPKETIPVQEQVANADTAPFITAE